MKLRKDGVMTYNRDYGSGGAVRANTEGTSLIDQHSFFNGIYRSPQDLRVEGQFEGEIHCDGTVEVADMARVSGSIEAGNVRVSGAVDGRVTCAERFEILSSGQVTAQVLAGSVIIRHGAYYDGEMRMHQEPEGLPQREVTAAATPMERIPGRGPARKPGAESVNETPAPVRAEPVQNQHEPADAPTLRAVPDA